MVAYFGVEGFSGQVEASRTLVGRLPDRGWEVHELVLPAPRSRGLAGLVGFALASVRSWFGTAALFLKGRHDVLALNVLLSRTGFLRMRPILALWRRLRGGPVILSLHGSNFLTWDESDPRSRELVRLVGEADATTVLSPRQRDVLVGRGVEHARVRVVPNTLPSGPETAGEAAPDPSRSPATDREGESSASSQDGPVRLLHLSNLIDSKGYAEYLDAVEHLVRSGVAVEAVLCGPAINSPWCSRFPSAEAKAQWVRGRVDEVNSGAGREVVEWRPGAWGRAKAELYAWADVFVFPSTYPVEAQPLVLVEAMAFGSGIVTTSTGEIGWTVEGADAEIVERPDGASLADAVVRIARPDRLARARQAGRSLYEERYAADAHLDAWDSLLCGVLPRHPACRSVRP